MVRYAIVAAALSLVTGCSGAPAEPGSPVDEPSAPSPPESAASAQVQVLELVADDAMFNTDRLDAVAGVPIVIAFDNRDGIRHNFQLWRDDSRSEKLFFGEIVGRESIEYELGPLPPGEYRFECHPHSQTMFGHLVVTEAPSD
jgi:plastocyanin